MPGRIDHRSLADQGIERIPQIHIGVAASAMERKGMRTERGDLHRQITAANQQIATAQAEVYQIERTITADRQPSSINFNQIRKDLEQLANRARENDRQKQQPPTPAPIQKPTYHQECQRISAEIKQLIIEKCEADPYTIGLPGFGESELEFIDRFSQYMTEKSGYINLDRTEPLQVISDYQREYDRRTFEYVAKYPSEIVRKEGLIELHFNVEEAMRLAGYDRQKLTTENELSPGNGQPIIIDPDYRDEEDKYEIDENEEEENLQDRLNIEVKIHHKSSQSKRSEQDYGMSM